MSSLTVSEHKNRQETKPAGVLPIEDYLQVSKDAIEDSIINIIFVLPA